MLRKFFALIILFSAISAHPVIFKNGKVFWLTQNPSFNDIRFGVSKSSNWLIGGRFLEDRKSNETFALINNNYLAKRWNNKILKQIFTYSQALDSILRILKVWVRLEYMAIGKIDDLWLCKCLNIIPIAAL